MPENLLTYYMDGPIEGRAMCCMSHGCNDVIPRLWQSNPILAATAKDEKDSRKSRPKSNHLKQISSFANFGGKSQAEKWLMSLITLIYMIVQEDKLWTVNGVPGQDPLENLRGFFTASEGSFQVKPSGKIPQKRCKDPSGTFQGSLFSDIIDDPQCNYVQMYILCTTYVFKCSGTAGRSGIVWQ